MSFHDSPIFPSIIAKDQSEFAERLMRISFSHTVHIDVMDGKFVPSISFDMYTDFSFSHLKHFAYVEVHLMVTDPTHWIDYLSDVTDLFIIHVENPDVAKHIAYIKSKGKNVGLAINPRTPIAEHLDLFTHVDHITVMTVEPGKYGSKFIPEMLRKVSKLREKFPEYAIECDGSMAEHTILSAQDAGANFFVVGSALQLADNPQRKFQLLNEFLTEHKD